MQPFDMSLVQRGARLRRSPFYEAEQRHGPRGYTVYNHMLFPTHFDDFESEYWHLLNHVTLWDVAVERCLEVSGKDGLRLAQMMTPRDLSACAVGQAKYVLICAPDGGILNDPVMTRMAENRFWFALASSDALFYAKGLAARSGLDVVIREADVHPLQIQGPKARDVVRALFGEELLNLKYYFFREAKIDGIPVIITRTGWTSEIGYEVYLLDPSRGTELWEKILKAGAPFNIRPTGPSDIRRIEGGIFNWGADMTYENNPFELGLERLVDFEMKGDCVAMDALRSIRDRGVARRIAGVELNGEPFPALNYTKWPAEVQGQPVGPVTSAIYSPRLKKNIGYCWLPSALAVAGTKMYVASEWGRRTATVTAMPFVDPEKRIPVS
jgi:glycine cleavage system aminomethyltransferase T